MKTSKPDSFGDLVRYVRQCTENNQHGEAREAILENFSQMTSVRPYYEAIVAINRAHQFEGHLTVHLRQAREAIFQGGMTHIREAFYYSAETLEEVL